MTRTAWIRTRVPRLVTVKTRPHCHTHMHAQSRISLAAQGLDRMLPHCDHICQGHMSGTTPDCPCVLTLALTHAHSGRPAYFVGSHQPPKPTHISMSMCLRALVLASIRPILLAIQDTHKRTHSHTHTSRSTGTHRHEQGLRL